MREGDLAFLRYCIERAAPGDVTPPFFDCPLPDSYLYWLLEDVGFYHHWLLEDVGFYHPIVANLALARAFDEGGMLDDPLTLRKKAVDLGLTIGGLRLGLRALFANFGTAQMPNFEVGAVLILEGTTVSGIQVRSETWIGARQGLECFAECKPLERLYGGIVIDEFTPQEEKIFLSNITLAGVTFHVRAEMQLFPDLVLPSVNCSIQVLCFFEITASLPVEPLGLELENTLRLGEDLAAKFDVVVATLRIGEAAVRAMWEVYPNATGVWTVYLAELLFTFDAPGVHLSSEIKFCKGITLVLCGSDEVLKHTIGVSARVGELTVEGRAILLELITGFYQLWIDASWVVGPVEVSSSVVFSSEYLSALAFGMKVRF